MKKSYLNVAVLLTSLTVPGMAATATFQVLATPFNFSGTLAVSGNGSVIAANSFGEIYRWTAARGFQDLGPGDPNNGSIAVSRDGSAIATGIIGADGFGTPGLWTAAGWQDLGHPQNGCTTLGNAWGSGWGINATGKVVVGLAWTCREAEGFVWYTKYGARSLGFPAGESSRASAISADANTIVGFWESSTGGRRPVRWVNYGKPELFLGANAAGEAYAVSSDGSQIVGQNIPPKGLADVAFVYSDAAGVTYLGTLSGKPTDQSFANGISDNGTVVGYSGTFRTSQAFIWSATTGMQSLLTALNNMGANIPSGVTLTDALAISADGTTIVGNGTQNKTEINWVATITQ